MIPEMHENLNWAVLGTGIIANEMAQALQKMGRSLYAVGNRTHEKAVTFAEKYGVSKVYDKIDDMFYDDAVDIIYIHPAQHALRVYGAGAFCTENTFW